MILERRDCVKIGILGCANIARKNIRAILLASEGGIGEGLLAVVQQAPAWRLKAFPVVV